MDEQTRGLEKLAALAESICDKRDRGVPKRDRTEADPERIGEAGDDKEQVELTLMYRKNIAVNVKRLRKLNRMRQVDLAVIMNSAQGQIAALEMAKISIGLHTLTRLASAFKVEPAALLRPIGTGDEFTPVTALHEPTQDHLVARDTAILDAPRPPQDRPTPASELVMGSLGIGISLTTVKEMAAAMHRRLEALERRHGSIPMTREMMTSVLLAVLHASQNIDEDDISGR